jgi:hypothetical protein
MVLNSFKLKNTILFITVKHYYIIIKMAAPCCLELFFSQPAALTSLRASNVIPSTIAHPSNIKQQLAINQSIN